MLIVFSLPPVVAAGPYANSAHGDSTIGVSRSAITALGYARGNCAHCHELHASIEGSEPVPAAGAAPYTLFAPNYVSQLDTLCYQCHVDVGSLQNGGVVNRTYAYRAGGWTAETLDDTLESFSFTSPGTAHQLDDILSFIDGRWGFTSASNPCGACHNPHSVSQAWPLSRPSLHATNPSQRWGDDAGERMNVYTARYQAPYRFASTTTFEPDGSSTQDGANLADIVTFCTDCHNTTNVIYSTTLGRNLRPIDWDNEKHGKGNADQYISVLPPYTAGAGSLGYVLSCLDCHEPHGSPNIFLLRREVNGAVLAGTVSSGAVTNLLCERCHDNAWESIHHTTNDRAYSKFQCMRCHGGYPQDCSRCHFHGAITGSDGVNQTTISPTNRRTF